MTIKRNVVFVLTLSAVVCGCVAHRPPRVEQEVTGDPRKNYLPFKTAEVPVEKAAEEKAPDFDNPVSRAKCEELMKAGKYGIRRMDSLEGLPVLEDLIKNDEAWFLVDDAYPRIKIGRSYLIDDWIDFALYVGKYSSLFRAAPIAGHCKTRAYREDDPDVDEGWNRQRQQGFVDGLKDRKIRCGRSATEYSGNFTYTREDDFVIYLDVLRARLLMDYLKAELADMKFPRYYRVEKVEFLGKRPGAEQQK